MVVKEGFYRVLWWFKKGFIRFYGGLRRVL